TGAGVGTWAFKRCCGRPPDKECQPWLTFQSTAPPIVFLPFQGEVQGGPRGHGGVDRAKLFIDEPEQMPIRFADDLDEEVERASGDDEVVDLVVVVESIGDGRDRSEERRVGKECG